jgi:hypothetical protein
MKESVAVALYSGYSRHHRFTELPGKTNLRSGMNGFENPGQPATKKGKDTPPMSKDNVIDLKKPELFIDDQITTIIR